MTEKNAKKNTEKVPALNSKIKSYLADKNFLIGIPAVIVIIVSAAIYMTTLYSKLEANTAVLSKFENTITKIDSNVDQLLVASGEAKSKFGQFERDINRLDEQLNTMRGQLSDIDKSISKIETKLGI